jgi:hypothetical protein
MVNNGCWSRSALATGTVVLSMLAALLVGAVPASASEAHGTNPAISDTLVTIYRFFFSYAPDPARGSDHLTDTVAPPFGLYTMEGPFGEISAVPTSNTKAIYQCGTFPGNRLFVDHFTSPDPGCEGQMFNHLIGYIFLTPPAGFVSVPITRCRDTANQEHFDSKSTSCEGQSVDGLLGYAIVS